MAGVSVPESLRVREGERLSAARDNALVRLAESLTLQRGSLKGRQEPGGFTPHVEVSSTSDPKYNFKAALGEDDDGKPVLTILTPGHVGGVVPVIVTANGKEVKIDDTTDASGTPPSLPIPDDAFAKKGNVERALVMMRYDLRPEDASVMKATFIAVPAPPAVKAWTWHKLCGFVIRQGESARWEPMIFFSQQFDVSHVSKDGRFKPWPRIA